MPSMATSIRRRRGSHLKQDDSAPRVISDYLVTTCQAGCWTCTYLMSAAKDKQRGQRRDRHASHRSGSGSSLSGGVAGCVQQGSAEEEGGREVE